MNDKNHIKVEVEIWSDMKGETSKRVKLIDKSAKIEAWFKDDLYDDYDIEFEDIDLTKHNNDFKKPCPNCDGEGEADYEIDDVQGTKKIKCPNCNGQGFIKS